MVKGKAKFPWGSAVFPGLLIMLSIVPPIVVSGLIASGWQSKSWHLVEGEVLHAEVKTRILRYFEREILSAEYQYSFQGKSYRNGDVTVQGAYIGGQMDAYKQRFRKGARVDVYVNPAFPEEAVLVPGLPSLVWFAFSISGLLLAMGALGMLLWYKVFYQTFLLQKRHDDLLKKVRG
ncbi:MAG: DUF3592 domain-containing protein [Opitutales bacterium]